jgi:hypothetical protein
MVWYLHDSFVLTESDFFFNWHWKSVAKNNLVFPSFTLTGNATIFFLPQFAVLMEFLLNNK